jgi:hypothetical protein
MGLTCWELEFAMWSYRCYTEEEGLVSSNGIVEESVCFVGDEVV